MKQIMIGRRRIIQNLSSAQFSRDKGDILDIRLRQL